jgi:hypothetical protein
MPPLRKLCSTRYLNDIVHVAMGRETFSGSGVELTEHQRRIGASRRARIRVESN